jgi:hypothetical protein
LTKNVLLMLKLIEFFVMRYVLHITLELICDKKVS